jgi:hypothetical protein
LQKYPSGLGVNITDYVLYVLEKCDRKKIAALLRIGPIKVGSFCTGAGTEGMVFDALEKEWNYMFARQDFEAMCGITIRLRCIAPAASS